MSEPWRPELASTQAAPRQVKQGNGKYRTLPIIDAAKIRAV
jgi:hypothetical protein